MSRWCVVLILCIASCGRAFSAAGAAAPSRDEQWTLLGNGNDQHFFSPLSQINVDTVEDLGLAWVAEIPALDGLAGNPLIADGVVYQSGPFSRIFAHDVRTGKLLWKFDPRVSLETSSLGAYFGARFNRGVALWEDKVIVATGDCRIVAVQRSSGKKVWDSYSCDPKELYSITAAPRVGGGKVFIGNTCLDSGVGRGFVDALDAQTGRRIWRFYTVPGPPTANGYESKALEMAAKTWGSGEWWKKSQGCGSAWEAITYDPETNLVYLGVGGPAPWNPAARAGDAGDELFTNCIVAVDADSGSYVWHYKVTPNDGWNLDATMQIMVADLPIAGRGLRHVVMTAPKNGFFYVLDAKTGAFVSANNFAPQNWAAGIDAKSGRPIPLRDAMYWKQPDGSAIVLPGPNGAHNWQPMAFNPATRLVYIPTITMPTLLKVDPKVPLGGVSMDAYYSLGSDAKWPAYGELVAWDPLAQESRWRVRHALPVNGGAMTTGGNLVFEGDAQGNFAAYRADTGERVWSAQVGAAIMAAPSTVEVDGQQMVIVPAGNAGSAVLGRFMAKYSSTSRTRGSSRLLAFKLGGSAALPGVAEIRVSQPPLPRQPADLASKGAALFEQNYCADCHGSRAEGAGGSVPDLRNSVAATHDRFEAIVMGGLLRNNGMPAFPDLSLADTRAIHAYLINQAWEDYEAQERQRTSRTTDPGAFTLSSPDLRSGGQIPQQFVLSGYGCTGGNISPTLEWSGAPPGTKSYVVTFFDPDERSTPSGWWHWVVYDIPSAVSRLPRGAGEGHSATLPAGALQGRSDLGTEAYHGPCPAKGDRAHHYTFTIYALSVAKLPVPSGASGAMVTTTLQAYSLAKATLVASHEH